MLLIGNDTYTKTQFVKDEVEGAIEKGCRLFIEDADALYAEYASRGVEFTRALGNTPWQSRELS